MKQFKNFGIIISGQPRSGKSTLANIFSKNSKFNVLKTDVLFIRHLKDNKLFKNYKDGVRNFLIVLGIKILKEKKKICKK